MSALANKSLKLLRNMKPKATINNGSTSTMTNGPK